MECGRESRVAILLVAIPRRDEIFDSPTFIFVVVGSLLPIVVRALFPSSVFKVVLLIVLPNFFSSLQSLY